ncbi:MAG TPA: hypothetical protein VK997_15245 [Deferrisomatales bacterium]|nr:hypothetical protein [Deferrisomatales bacterium]
MASSQEGSGQEGGGFGPPPKGGQDLRKQYEQFEAIHRQMEEVYAAIYRRFVHPAGPPFYEEGVEGALPPSLIPEHRAVAKVLFDYLEALHAEARILANAKSLCEQHGYADNPDTRAATREVLEAILQATKHRTAFGRVLDKDWLAVWEQATRTVPGLPAGQGARAGGGTGWLNEVVDRLLAERGSSVTAGVLWDSTSEWVGVTFGCGEVSRRGEFLHCAGARSCYRPVKFRTFRQTVAARRKRLVAPPGRGRGPG